MSEKLNTDNSFREKLENFSVPPPPHIWDNVQGQLALQKRKKRLAYMGWITAAAVVVLAFLAGWYFNEGVEVIPQMEVAQQAEQTNPEENRTNEGSTKEIDNVQAIQTENDQKEESADRIKNKNFSIVSTGLIEEGKQGNDLPASNREDIEKLKSKNVEFENVNDKITLANRYYPEEKYFLSEKDKTLMAENISNVKPQGKSETGWKMGMHLAPAYSSNVSDHTESYAQNMNYSGENGNGNIGAGISVQYKTSKKLRIESGIYYAQNGQKSENAYRLLAYSSDANFANLGDGNQSEYLSGSVPAFSNSVRISNGNMAMNSTAGVIEMRSTPKGAQITSELEAKNPEFSNSLVTDGEFSQVFDFIEIPLYLRYNLLDKKFGIELMGGLNAGVVVGNNAYIDNSYGVQNVGKTQDISTVNLAGTIGLGANYNMGKHFSVALEPRLNYYFNSINTNPDVVYRPYRIGLYTGLYYEF